MVLDVTMTQPKIKNFRTNFVSNEPILRSVDQSNTSNGEKNSYILTICTRI
jgi:hypothetical protein